MRWLASALLLIVLVGLFWMTTRTSGARFPTGLGAQDAGSAAQAAAPSDGGVEAELAGVVVASEAGTGKERSGPSRARDASTPADRRALDSVQVHEVAPFVEAIDEAAPLEEDWPPPPVGSITGSLLPDAGVFRGDTAALLRGLRVDLVSRVEPHVTKTAQLTPVHDEAGELVRIDFVAEELPDLEFELTLSSLDRWRWYPETQLVLPPMDGMEFVCFNDEPTAQLAFEVFDAETGETIGQWEAFQMRVSVSVENGVLMHAGPLDLDSFPVQSALQWVIESDGYAPAYGNERAFEVDPETQRWRARVGLQRGFATRVVVLGPDPSLKPVAGARLALDGGEVLLRTDSAGQLEIRGAAAPTTIRVEWRGLVAEGAFGEVCLRRRSYLRVVVLGR